jgi:hypothetical protein
MSDLDLQQALRALGARLEAEPEIDIAPVVLARIGATAPRAARPRQPLRIVVVGLAIALLATAVAVATSQTVRGWLREHGVDVSRSDSPVPRATAGDLRSLGLGTPVTGAEAEGALGQPLPTSDRLGAPTTVLLDKTSAGDVVTLVWRPGPALPATPVLPDIGALLTVGPPDTGDEAIIIGKSLTPRSSPQFVEIPRLGSAVWIAGAPHAVRLFDGRSVGFRMAANALLWSDDSRLVRLESALSRTAAIAVAASLQ